MHSRKAVLDQEGLVPPKEDVDGPRPPSSGFEGLHENITGG
jgi:hypothetical protein